jgi:hypothetical protein
MTGRGRGSILGPPQLCAQASGSPAVPVVANGGEPWKADGYAGNFVNGDGLAQSRAACQGGHQKQQKSSP